MYTNEDQKNNASPFQNIPEEEWSAKRTEITPEHMNKMIHEYLYYEGHGEILLHFCNETKLPAKNDRLFQSRSLIRTSLEEGDIDKAISRINDLNTEILDENIELYYKLLQHKAVEYIHIVYNNRDIGDEDALEKTLSFIQNELSHLVEGNPTLLPQLEELLEYLVFNSGECIDLRRRQIASYVNQEILKMHNEPPNAFKEMVKGIITGENKLSAKYKFPTFKEYFNTKNNN